MWVTQEIELKYRAMVRAITTARRDERRTICGDFSQTMRGESTESQDNPIGSPSGEPLLCIHTFEPSLDRAEEICGETDDNAEKDSALSAPPTDLKEGQEDPYDNWG